MNAEGLKLTQKLFPDEITLIRAAKEAGAKLTCEVTPHHLFLTEADAQRLGAYGDMRPRLASNADVAARAEAESLSLEHAGRKCRFELFAQVSVRTGAGAVALAAAAAAARLPSRCGDATSNTTITRACPRWHRS